LQDDDPYVRKTAAVCVAKLFDINPELVEDRGFLDMLRVRSTASGAAAAQQARR
jgi:vesicle coat complex subunit